MDISQDIVDESLDRLVNEPEMQKRLYLAGVIVGQGIKQGIGIQGKGGKFKFENIIGQAIGAVLQNVIPQAIPQTQQPQVLIPEHLK